MEERLIMEKAQSLYADAKLFTDDHGMRCRIAQMIAVNIMKVVPYGHDWNLYREVFQRLEEIKLSGVEPVSKIVVEDSFDLNDNELRVLIAIKDEIIKSTGVEFGLISRIDLRMLFMSKAQFNGYLSILVKKDLIETYHLVDGKDQVKLTKKGCEILIKMNHDVNRVKEIIEQL